MLLILYLFLDLRKFILNEPNGVRDDDDLRSCYIGIDQDIEELKKEGWLRDIIPAAIHAAQNALFKQ